MNLISRKEGIEKLSSLYFTGKKCKNGHLAERYVSNRRCTQCAKHGYAHNTKAWLQTPEGKLRKAKHAKTYRESEKGRIHRLLDNARRRAKKKGLECTIDSSDITIPEFCPITGIKIEYGDDGGLNLN